MSDPTMRGTLASMNPRVAPLPERRNSSRHDLRDAYGVLSWKDGSRKVSCPMEVFNISGGGVAVLAEQAPQVGESVRIQFGNKLALVAPLEGRTVATSAHQTGRHVVRIQFTHWIPLDAILERHRERRIWQRYPARETRATLTWIDGSQEIRVRGELSNISGGGAAVIVADIIPDDRSIWFELEAKLPGIEPVESRLVVTSLDPSGAKIARIRFVDPCPLALFELAVNGAS
jgi:hypothetical protein